MQTNDDLFVNVASSNLETADAENAFIKKGDNIGLVFANTGTVIPDDESIQFYVTDNKKSTSVSGEANGPIEDDLSLTVEPLIPKILANSEFPIIGYLLETEAEDEEGVTSTERRRGEWANRSNSFYQRFSYDI